MIELIKYNGTPLEVCGLGYWKALAKDKANAFCFFISVFLDPSSAKKKNIFETRSTSGRIN